MCGRVTLTRANLDEVAHELGADFDAEDAARYRPRYNGVPLRPALAAHRQRQRSPAHRVEMYLRQKRA
jgi:hypothetical protein